jgi:hypothetical protein
VDRRRSARYDLHVPILFAWEEGRVKRANGVSRDLGVAGAYISCEEKAACPNVGATVAIEILLPMFEAREKGLRLKAEGTVMRVSGAREPVGFAVRSNFLADADTTARGHTPDNKPASDKKLRGQTGKKLHGHVSKY